MRSEPRTGWRRAHGVSALVVSAFVTVHLANHLVALAGVDAHAAFMHAARRVYRHPVVEAVLLAAVGLQLASGLAMLATRRWPRAPLARLQAVAGLALAAFLLVHVGAVLGARSLLGLDTSFHFAAAGFHAGPWVWFFAPYYGLAVLAWFVHLGCAMQRRRRGVTGGWGFVGPAALLGAVVALPIVGCLAGVLIPVEIPAPHLAPYQAIGLGR